MRAMQVEHETVHTVTDYYDGPRGGIVSFHGRPHAYKSLWDDSEDDWSDTLLLQPIDEETFRLAMEDWAIWRRWESAFHSVQTDLKTHPALPADRARHDELATILKPRLEIDAERAIRVRGRFDIHQSPESCGSSTGVWIVRWLGT
jgi:hypothetical protein